MHSILEGLCNYIKFTYSHERICYLKLCYLLLYFPFLPSDLYFANAIFLCTLGFIHRQRVWAPRFLMRMVCWIWSEPNQEKSPSTRLLQRLRLALMFLSFVYRYPQISPFLSFLFWIEGFLKGKSLIRCIVNVPYVEVKIWCLVSQTVLWLCYFNAIFSLTQ